MESQQKLLNKQQMDLNSTLLSSKQHEIALERFMNHHAMLHSAKVAQTGSWSFEDEVLDDLAENQFRRIPNNTEHSIAWCLWHLARIEDVTMNLLVAGGPQLVDAGELAGETANPISPYRK